MKLRGIKYQKSLEDVHKYNEVSILKTVKEAGVPIVSLEIEDVDGVKRDVMFLCDTGADECYLDETAIKGMKLKKLGVNRSGLTTGSGVIMDERNVVAADVYVNGKVDKIRFTVYDYSVPFDQIASECGIRPGGILGSNFFDEFNLTLDFRLLRIY